LGLGLGDRRHLVCTRLGVRSGLSGIHSELDVNLKRASGSRSRLARRERPDAPLYPLIVEAVNALKVRSCLIDGEAVACDENGLAVIFELRGRSGKAAMSSSMPSTCWS
jgi:ATP-dependent DNA ligase